MSSVVSIIRHALLHAVLFTAAVIGAISGAFSRLLPATELHANDNLVLFVTAARLSADGQHFRIPLHGWVHQKEAESSLRKAVIAFVRKALHLEANSLEVRFLTERLGWFLVDNKRTRLVRLSVLGQDLVLGPTDPQGHFMGEVTLRRALVTSLVGGSVIDVEVRSPSHAHGTFGGKVLLPGRTGLSVISDLDDTVKESHVLDKKELLRNTLLRAFRPVASMAELFCTLEKAGAMFHYVSCSPWHLYPTIESFLREAGFPRATMTLKRLRLKDSSVYEFFSKPGDFKLPKVLELIDSYPERRFLLVGDSGEVDPEVYGEVARLRPEQVLGILIRDVQGDRDQASRWQRAFRGIDPTLVQIFADPREIQCDRWLALIDARH